MHIIRKDLVVQVLGCERTHRKSAIPVLVKYEMYSSFINIPFYFILCVTK